MKAREGELIKTKDNVIFDVKGLVHPPNKVIAFPRYIPSPQGTRGSQKDLYGKIYSLSERFKFLEQESPNLIVHDPVFDETLCEVPINTIKKHYLSLTARSDRMKGIRQQVQDYGKRFETSTFEEFDEQSKIFYDTHAKESRGDF